MAELNIKEKVEELVDKIKGDPALMKSFKDDPVKAVEKLIGIDLPDEKIEALVAGIKAKITMGDLGDKLGGLKKLF